MATYLKLNLHFYFRHALHAEPTILDRNPDIFNTFERVFILIFHANEYLIFSNGNNVSI